MSEIGSHPLKSFVLGIPTNVTIAASMAGTAAATLIVSSISVSYARSIEVFNLTLRNVELILSGGDNGTAGWTPGTPSVVSGNSIFCPGTASTAGLGRSIRKPLKIDQGMSLYVRTTENTPITCASTTPLIISFWA